MDDKALDDLLDSALSEVYEHIISTEYNGVSGWPADWVPDWHVQEFQQTRNRLLEKYSEAQIIEWISAYDTDCIAANNSEYVRLTPIPLEVRKDISLLALIRKADSLGRTTGLPMLIGDDDAKKMHTAEVFSKGGSTKKGKHYEPKKSIKVICNEIGSFALDDILDFLRDAERCGDIYESTQTPTGVLFSSVDDDKRSISFTKRGKDPNEAKTITFDRLRNILSELK